MATSKPKTTDAPADDDGLDFPDEAPASTPAPDGEQTAEQAAAEWIDDGSATRAAALMAAAAFKASANISVADLIDTARELEPYLNGVTVAITGTVVDLSEGGAAE
ncbi:hypothetical protein [Agreia sp. VKM Ac-1783]|uniref:hypothetical protein n=1 Tax=Agreia sp. VKM Ac-1783 TaxID=1938889 RepID=UPI000A2AA46D|nr:hypothetical protein [Agreia sp. VKM Ac-1783]SMQ73486.1 hypothetical protein SAMN06295943_2893 [Agreia sp. VKM Ac-1783]